MTDENTTTEVPEIPAEKMEEFQAELNKLSVRFFNRGVATYRKSLLEAFSVIAMRDVPGKEQKFTAVEVIRHVKHVGELVSG